LAHRVLKRYTDWQVTTNYSCPQPICSPDEFFVGTELDALEESPVQMVAPQVVGELDVEFHEEASHSDEDLPEVSLLGSNTSLDTFPCHVKIHSDRYYGEMSFQLEKKEVKIMRLRRCIENIILAHTISEKGSEIQKKQYNALLKLERSTF